MVTADPLLTRKPGPFPVIVKAIGDRNQERSTRIDSMQYRFAGFTFDTEERELYHSDQSLQLRPLLADLLAFFLAREGRILSKNQLIEGVWPDTAVSDDALFRAIGDLRKVLDEAQPGCDLIKTQPRKGYRFECESLTVLDEFISQRDIPMPIGAEVELTRHSQTQPRYSRSMLLGGALITGLALAVTWITTQRGPEATNPRQQMRIGFLPFVNDSGDENLKWVELGLVDMMSDLIADVPGLDSVPTADMLPLVDRNRLAETQHAQFKEQLDALFSLLGCQAIVSGNITKRDSETTITFSIHSPDGKTETQTCSHESALGAAQLMAGILTSQFARDQQAPRLEDRYSNDDYVNETYAKGLQRLAMTGPNAAAPYFTICLEQDAGFLWAAIRLAHCEYLQGQWEVAMDRIEAVIAQARVKENDALLAFSLHQKAERLSDQGRYADARNALTKAIQAYERQGNDYGRANCLLLSGSIAYEAGQADNGEQSFRDALTIFEAINDKPGQARVLNNMGLKSYIANDFQGAKVYFNKALELNRTSPDRAIQAQILGNLSLVLLDEGNHQHAIDTFTRIKKIYAEMGNALQEAWATVGLAFANYYGENFEQAEIQALEALKLTREVGERRLELFVVGGLAFFALCNEQPDQAEPYIKLGLEMAEGSEASDPAEQMWAVAVWYYTQRDDLDTAKTYAARIDPKTEDGNFLLMLAHFAYRSGNYALAHQQMAHAKRSLGKGSWLPGLQRRLEVMERAARDQTYIQLPPLVTPQSPREAGSGD